MKKSELKMLIKECLVELLAEGLGGSLVEATSRRVQGRVSGTSKARSFPAHDPLLDRRVAGPSRGTSPNAMLQERIKAESGGNPVLADILADTAMTTLQTQMANEGRQAPVASDAASMAVAQSSPEELFGEEAASKWAALAFAGPVLPK